MKLLDSGKTFYKGNFHTHTTCSDGHRTPEEAMAIYRRLGYDFLAITDHRMVTDPGPAPDGLLTIPGIELDYMLETQAVHILGIGVTPRIVSLYNPDGKPQQAIDAIHACGGEAILCHPAWSLNTPETMASFQGLAAAEVWNSVSTLPYNAMRSDSSSLLDVTSALGQVLPMVANDDTHFYGQEVGKGFTVVQADSLTVPDVVGALRDGRFYASQGPRFEQLELTEDELIVTCSPVDTVIFYSSLVWVDDRATLRPHQTHAVYPLTHDPRETFVRCQIIDSEGRSAWSSPVAVRALP